MTTLDPRLHAYRPGLADIGLKGIVASEAFVVPDRMQVAEPLVSVRKSPSADAMQLTQALMGETVKVFEQQDDWAWVQLEQDGYTGYIKARALNRDILEPTHRVAVPGTFLYPKSNLKSQPTTAVTLNARLTVVGCQDGFSELSNGRFVFSGHLETIDAFDTDFVTVAEMFRRVPYYWGGKSVRGLDCSGLVQLALEASGIPARRDSDMQEDTLGLPVPVDDFGGLKRGDLIFWDGHVGIMTDNKTLLHANGHHMMVQAEPLETAVERIALRYGRITSIKRL
jgi:cell wall-associated NlpC family hydrolase